MNRSRLTLAATNDPDRHSNGGHQRTHHPGTHRLTPRITGDQPRYTTSKDLTGPASHPVNQQPGVHESVGDTSVTHSCEQPLVRPGRRRRCAGTPWRRSCVRTVSRRRGPGSAGARGTPAAFGSVGHHEEPEEDQLTVLRDTRPTPLAEGIPLLDGHHPLGQRQNVHLLVTQMLREGVVQIGEGVGELRPATCIGRRGESSGIPGCALSTSSPIRSCCSYPQDELAVHRRLTPAAAATSIRSSAS